jgi:hypothetical protein
MKASGARRRPKLKLFHATVHVTRMEEWWVEAETAEEARKLLLSGQAHRGAIGDCLHATVERMLDE